MDLRRTRSSHAGVTGSAALGHEKVGPGAHLRTMLKRLRPLAAAAVLLAACSPSAPDAQPLAAAAAVRSTGLDAQLLATAVAQAQILPRLNSLIVARDGQVVAERVFDGPGLDTPVNIKSASKSVLAALVGIGIARGELSGLSQPVAPLLSARTSPAADPRVNAITVEHLLSMRAGLQSTSGGNYGAWAASPDWVRFALAQPFVDQPGGRMIYSTGTSHLMSAALSRATGRSTLELARDWLGEPLGIEVPAWPRDPQGTYFGGNDMRMSPRALLRFGELYRNDGVHAGRRILPEGWVQASWTSRARSPWSAGGYGLGWWISEMGGRPVYFAWGYGGQMVYVVPDLALTVVMTSDSDARSTDGHLQALHALMADGFIPAAERGGTRSAI